MINELLAPTIQFQMQQQNRVIAHDIKMKYTQGNYIRKIKEMLKYQQNENTNSSIISLYDDVLMYLQVQVLQKFHSRHLEKLRMKALMKSYIYWPTMERNIENCIKPCRAFS